ncbi:MAG: dTDP-4-dehydrorhamnose 3,5-epimerase, partial [Alphaproteobacteria bacterium]
MNFHETEIPGVMVVEVEKRSDERGYFARTFCAGEFAAAGLPARFVQANVSYNARRGTLRGLHYQAEPKPEPKLVRCTRGAVFDVAVDLRPDSPAFCRWTGHELSADNQRGLYIPPGCAHGFVTLEDDTETFYLMGEFYDAALARGVRWNDPAFAIDWLVAPSVISPRDAGFPDF